ncbi:MAG: PilZ domain-containing protein [Elusimicrobiota bacterium]
MKKRGVDKRRHPRFPVGIAMDIHLKGQAVQRCRGTISDLSVGGMSLRADADLEHGSSLYLKINIPLEIRGEVRHIKSGSRGGMHRYGVRFHHIGFEGAGESRPESFIAAKFQK